MNKVWIFLFLIFLSTLSISYSPYYTYTVGVGKQLVRIQDAYEPVKKLHFNVGTLADLFWKNGKLYLADGDNAIVYVTQENISTMEYQITNKIGEGQLIGISGIFVDSEENVYVADSWSQQVLKFSNDGKLLLSISKPTSPIYGQTNDFVPLKLAADRRGNVYVVCQGVTNGLAVFNRYGQFLSFYGANEPKVTFRMILQRILFTESQKAQLLKIRPPSPTSLAIDDFGSVWTVTQGLKEDAIKRFNVAGVNIYPTLDFSSDNFVDLDVDKYGNVYALTSNGLIYIYDNLGNLIFIFGGQSFYENRLGLFRTPVAISVSDEGEIFILDKEDSSITVLRKTNFGKLVLKGVQFYNQGLYLEGENVWNEILKFNSAFILTYKVLGNIEFKKGNYAKAFNYFKIAQDEKGYSEAFWYLRNVWLQKFVGLIFLIVVLLAIFDIVRTLLKRQGIILNKPSAKKKKQHEWQLQIKYSLLFLKNPFDAVYEMKRKNRISPLTAMIFYALLYIENIIIKLVGSPLFVGFEARKINFISLFFDTYKFLFLFVLSNYLVSEISEGEGRFKDIFIGTIEAFLPYILFSVPLALITNFLTLNESFIYNFGMQIIWAWSIIWLVIIIAQIHNFSFSETVKNLILTFFTMILISILIVIIFILVREEVSFLTSLFEELIFRARTK
ncbi:MAG: NHL repeat-containing protein [Fervidobacterium sp.]|nr:NHL repeat-containing protein [Fervidobacterium sp.]